MVRVSDTRETEGEREGGTGMGEEEGGVRE